MTTAKISKKAAVVAIRAAWKNYQQADKRGLEFGKVCYEWQQKFVTKGGYGTKGKGLVQLLDELNIPKSTAYWWIDRYEISEGLKQPKTVNPNFNKAGTRGFKGKPRLNLFLRKLMAIGAVGVTSPFPSVADHAFKECDSQEIARAVIANLDLAIERLKEYRKKFEEV